MTADENKKENKKDIKMEKRADIEIIEKIEELEECKKKCEEYLAGWKRERADFINHKKDETERMGELIKFANEEVILKILPILDNIYLAESHIPEKNQSDDWVKGLLQIKNQILDLLKKEGIEPIKTIRERFDPNFMEAIEELEDANFESGTVVEETQKGYILQGKLIRPAKVKISR